MVKVVNFNSSEKNTAVDQLANFSSLYSPSMAKYYQLYASGAKFDDRSFIVTKNSIPILVVFLTETEQKLGWFGLPFAVFESSGADSASLEHAYDEAKTYLEGIFDSQKIASAHFREIKSALSPIGQMLLQRGAKASPFLNREIDLTAEETELRSQVRKSYKSLINWGEKNISWKLLDGPSAKVDEFMEFQKLHIEVAGKETRSAETWKSQFEMIKQNEAFAYFGFIDGTLETASLFNCYSHHCFYSVSASNRELFDKPLLHAAIWKAIVHAKAKGMKVFDFGPQTFPNHPATDEQKKLVDISTFKRGFGGLTKIGIELVL